ncbi:MAG: hypothetical protein JSV09_14990 [Thermoplasmata archaeon]|nr:MAG: hypothetical protein JSV09_14990 [Thermoplasmata archaeon]
MKRGLGIIILVFAFLVIHADGLRGDEFEVSNASDLQSALSAAEANAEDDVIKVAQGTYVGSFVFSSVEGNSITLLGGYFSDFSGRVINPSNTVLDANNLGRVLLINCENGGGDIRIEGFTIRNSYAPEDHGGGIYVQLYTDIYEGPTGKITIANNIITGNRAERYAGVYANSHAVGGVAGDIILVNNTITGNESSDMIPVNVVAWSLGEGTKAGDIYFASNIITENSGSYEAVKVDTLVTLDMEGTNIEFVNNLIARNDCDGGVDATLEGIDAHATFTNNTIADNNGTGLDIFSAEGGTINVYNNIIWNNGDEDIRIFFWIVPGVANGYNNDYLIMASGEAATDWTNEANNIHLDPLFLGAANYYLQPTSPCIDSGDNSASLLPAEDIEGNPRILDGNNDGNAIVDMGAFEYFGLPVFIDIKPGSCPNPLNTKSKGVLPVVVLGTEDFDVTAIDPASIKLEGTTSPLRWDYEDVATPFEGELCDCHDVEGDGYLDLSLKFDTQELVASLSTISNGDVITVTITGRLKEEFGGEMIRGKDCIVIRMHWESID